MSKINVYSFDFDGCIYNINYRCDSTDDIFKSNLIEANERLISTLSEKIKEEKVNEVIFMVGSNRQSISVDQYNAGGSCYPALIHLCEEFKRRDNTPHREYRVDRYLLADTYGKRALGENFTNAIQKDTLITRSSNFFKPYPFSSVVFDHSKLTILYAQMNKVASEHPQDEIEFNFYDDKLEILSPLQQFFSKHPDFIPKNLKLNLHFYNGIKIYNVPKIQGVAEIDDNYQENTRLMTNLCLEDYQQEGNILHLLAQHANRNLNQFMAQRKIQVTNRSTEENLLPREQDISCSIM